MKNVTLVGTVHCDDHGSAISVDALIDIIEHIQPDVFFLEMHCDNYYDFFGYPGFFGIAQRSNIESLAEIHYCRKYGAMLIPVDLQCPEQKHFDDHKMMAERVMSVSQGYCALFDQQRDRRHAGGFAFLNSKDAEDLSDMICEQEQKVLDSIGDANLLAIRERWDAVIEARDDEMLRNIYAYAEKNNFGKGAFLVGAAHRRALRRKIVERKSNLIKWTFWGD